MIDRYASAFVAALMIALLVPLAFVSSAWCDDASPASEESSAHEGDHEPGHDGHDDGGHAAHDSDGGHGHHNEYDLSHANASSSLEDASEFKADLAIWTFIVFLLLLAILTKFAWGPIVEGLDRREQTIAGSIEEARRIKEEAQKISADYDKKLAAAADEVRAMLDEARRDAEVTKQRIVAEAQSAAADERNRALRDIELAKYDAIHELKQSSVDMAFSLARNVVKRELNSADHASLVQEAVEKMPGPEALN